MGRVWKGSGMTRMRQLSLSSGDIANQDSGESGNVQETWPWCLKEADLLQPKNLWDALQILRCQPITPSFDSSLFLCPLCWQAENNTLNDVACKNPYVCWKNKKIKRERERASLLYHAALTGPFTFLYFLILCRSDFTSICPLNFSYIVVLSVLKNVWKAKRIWCMVLLDYTT